MKLDSQSILVNNFTVIIASPIIALVGIYHLYGSISVIYPSFTDWMAQGDLASYHICSMYFALDEWRWPLGANPLYGDGFAASIAQCTPSFIFSIFDKLLTHLNIIGHDGQHHGWIVLLNFSLQFLSSYMLFELIYSGTKRRTFSVLSAILLMQIPEFLVRNAGHLDLGAHYLIIFSILSAVTWRSYAHLKFLAILMVAVFTHVYLFGMAFGLYLAACAMNVAEATRGLSLRAQILAFARMMRTVAIVTLMPICLFYLFTGVQSSPRADGYGLYRADILTFFDGNGSIIFGDIPSDPGEYEGSFYLGAGIIIVFFAFCVGLLKNSDDVAILFRKNKLAFFVCFSVLVSYSVFAFSNKVSFISYEIYIPLNAWEQVGSIFRASGRFIWVPGYLVCFISIYFLSRWLSQSRLVILVLIANIVQFVEASYWAPIPLPAKWNTELVGPMEELAKAGYLGLRTLHPGFAPPGQEFLDLVYPAAFTGLSTDQFYLARADDAKTLSLRRTRTASLMAGNYDRRYVYIVDSGSSVLELPLQLQNGDSMFAMGDKYAIASSDIPEARNFRKVPPPSAEERAVASYKGDALEAFLGAGWDAVESWGGVWSRQERADISLPLKLTAGGRITLKLTPIGDHASPKVLHPITVTCPDGGVAQNKEARAYSCEIPLNPGGWSITISVPEVYEPRKLGINPDGRQLGVALEEIIVKRY